MGEVGACADKAATRCFLGTAAVIGALFFVVTPPFQAPDEDKHFFRAWAVSEGRLIAERRGGKVGFTLPVELPHLVHRVGGDAHDGHDRVDPQAIRAALGRRRADSPRRFIASPNSAFTSCVPYLPQAAGVLIGRGIRASTLGCLYLARALNLLIGSVLIALALRALPGHRWFLMMVALAPMATFLRSTVSADVVTMGLCFWFVAKIAASCFDSKMQVRAGRWVGISALSVLVCLTKLPYAPLAGLPWLIPRERFVGGILVWPARLFQVAAALIATAVSIWIAVHFGSPLREEVPLDPGKQVRLILLHPFRFAAIAVGDYMIHGPRYLAQTVGQLGWLDINLPKTLIVGYLAAAIYVFWADGNAGVDARTREVLGFAVAVIAVLGLVSASQYVSWTAHGAGVVEGIQGRYFLPLIPAAVWVFPFRRQETPRHVRWVALLSVALAAAVALDAVVRRYQPSGWASLFSYLCD